VGIHTCYSSKFVYHNIKKKEKKNTKKGKKNTKKKKRNTKKEKKKKKREDTCTIADEQPSTLGEPDFRKVLGYRSP
jgi:hypothetical protein